MPNNLHHVSVQTADSADLTWFLKEVAGFRAESRIAVPTAATAELLRWPANSGTTATLHGEPPGMFEIINIPSGLRDSIPAGVAMLTIGTRNIAAAIEQCRKHGLPVTEQVDLRDALKLLACRVEIGGLAFELVQYNEQ